MLIPYSQPLDIALTLESGQAFRWKREGDWICGVIFNNIVKIRQTEEGIEFKCAPDNESVMEPFVRDYLSLDDNLEAICEEINVDEGINLALGLHPGMRILRQEPWECLISFICSANSNIPRITANVEDMSKHFGTRLKLGDYERSAFPTPDALAEAGEHQLRRLRLGFRAKYVSAVARIIAAGDMDLFGLRKASYQEALDTLTTLPGVGDKVANCILLFSLDKLEAFPVDVWIDRVLREWYSKEITLGEEKKLSRKAMRFWAQRHFGSYAGYANQYLFQGRRLQGKLKD